MILDLIHHIYFLSCGTYQTTKTSSLRIVNALPLSFWKGYFTLSDHQMSSTLILILYLPN